MLVSSYEQEIVERDVVALNGLRQRTAVDVSVVRQIRPQTCLIGGLWAEQ
ncbi:MAG: hypothetical protein OXI96_05075 [Acidimicrobiaceae bacterium]|nr:hypothetical protein [Acidimicrobiaceae bacterium]